MQTAVLNEPELAPPAQTTLSGVGMKSSTVLIAEDAPDTRLTLARTLEFDDVRYLQAAGGEEALAMAMKYRPDLMLLDLMLPKLDGFQVLMQLKSLNLPTKVCIVSAVEDEDFIRRALDLGASDYIVKPVIPDIVLHKVRSLTESSEDPSYFRLPCSLSGTLASDAQPGDCQIREITEVGLTLCGDSYHRVGEVLALHSPSLARVMRRETPLLVSVTGARRNGRFNQRFDLSVEFVGLPETQRQRLRAEIIRGKFMTDQVLLN